MSEEVTASATSSADFSREPVTLSSKGYRVLSKSEKDALDGLKPILPRTGLVFTRMDGLKHVLCKPKILPLKSITLQKIEAMEKEACERLANDAS